jgi:hypothetical protein
MAAGVVRAFCRGARRRRRSAVLFPPHAAQSRNVFGCEAEARELRILQGEKPSTDATLAGIVSILLCSHESAHQA